MRGEPVRTLGAAVLLLCSGAAVAFGQTQTPTKGPSVSQAVQQLEHDWVDASKAHDTDKLGAILADDWVGIGFGGERATKQSYLADVKSGKNTLESFDFGPMSVKVLGNVAVVQGSDTEKSAANGKDTSGKYLWTDVFVKREDKWVVVRSQTAIAK